MSKKEQVVVDALLDFLDTASKNGKNVKVPSGLMDDAKNILAQHKSELAKHTPYVLGGSVAGAVLGEGLDRELNRTSDGKVERLQKALLANHAFTQPGIDEDDALNSIILNSSVDTLGKTAGLETAAAATLAAAYPAAILTQASKNADIKDEGRRLDAVIADLRKQLRTDFRHEILKNHGMNEQELADALADMKGDALSKAASMATTALIAAGVAAPAYMIAKKKLQDNDPRKKEYKNYLDLYNKTKQQLNYGELSSIALSDEELLAINYAKRNSQRKRMKALEASSIEQPQAALPDPDANDWSQDDISKLLQEV
jgi:hypothetical protein